MQTIARDFKVVVPVSYYERVGETTFNTVAVIDADGTIMGQYRKTHIPDDHFYQEKFYFTPGNTGFKVWDTAYAKIGVGICWDQWFRNPRAAWHCRALNLLFYPTAIGSEPILDCDSMPHWRRCMQGHAAANIMPLIAANRIGTETVKPTEDNQHQSSSLTFYGSSFIADETGALVEQADRENAGVLTHTFDLDEIREMRRSWGCLPRPGDRKCMVQCAATVYKMENSIHKKRRLRIFSVCVFSIIDIILRVPPEIHPCWCLPSW